MRTGILLALVLLTAVELSIPAQSNKEGFPPGFGAIEGMVLDADNRPVPQAKAYATSKARPAERGPTVYTDKDGKFFLRAVRVGPNIVHASKEAAGYPDTYFAFFSEGSGTTPEVDVRPGGVTRGVLVKLGAPSGALTGKVLDARSGKPVVSARIILTRQDDPKTYVSLGPESPGGGFYILVPPARFTMRILATGYKDWQFDGPLTIASRQTKEITVLLEPAGRQQE